MYFATVEGPLLLALIGRRYDLKLAQERVEPEVMITLRPKGGIRMTLHRAQQPQPFLSVKDSMNPRHYPKSRLAPHASYLAYGFPLAL